MKNYMDNLSDVAASDVSGLRAADREYGGSWLRRGGVGAFMMLARKWDRLETALQPHPKDPYITNGSTQEARVPVWDILSAAEADQRYEGIIDDIRDLRRYLLLVESEILTRQSPPDDTETEQMTAYLQDVTRFPTTVREFDEFKKLGQTTIKGGTMDGYPASVLYLLDHSLSSTQWTMSHEHHEEYAT